MFNRAASAIDPAPPACAQWARCPLCAATYAARSAWLSVMRPKSALVDLAQRSDGARVATQAA